MREKITQHPDKCSKCGSTKSKDFWDFDDGTVLCNKCYNTKKEIKKQPGKFVVVISWIFGIIFLINGLSIIFTNSVFLGILIFIGSLIIIPYTCNLISKWVNFEISGKIKWVAVAVIIILLIINSMISDSDKVNKKEDTIENDEKQLSSEVSCQSCSENYCVKQDYYECVFDSDNCSSGVLKGKLLNQCGVTCLTTEDCPRGLNCRQNKCCQNECIDSHCDNYEWVECVKSETECYKKKSLSYTIGKCGVECTSTSSCETGEICSKITHKCEGYSLNQEVKAGTLTWKITGSSTSEVIGGDYFNSIADGIYLILSVEVTNTGNSAQYVSGTYVKLVDEKNREFSADSGASFYLGGDGIFYDQINPGITKKGYIVYDVPEDMHVAGLLISNNELESQVYRVKLLI
ncbi:MAG: DUF4352 domain-containing protein [Candidatus Nanoarchaeia archaeon]